MRNPPWFKWGLGAVRQEVISWANVDKDPCGHIASPGCKELISYNTPKVHLHGGAMSFILSVLENFIISLVPSSQRLMTFVGIFSNASIICQHNHTVKPDQHMQILCGGTCKLNETSCLANGISNGNDLVLLLKNIFHYCELQCLSGRTRLDSPTE